MRNVGDSSPGRPVAAAVVLVLVLLGGARLGAEEAVPVPPSEWTGGSLSRGDYWRNYAHIPAEALSEVFRRDEEGLRRNLLLGGVLAGTLMLDQAIRDYTREGVYDGDNSLSRFLYNLGSVDHALPGMAAVYGVSLLTRNYHLRDTLLLSFQSLAVTQGFTELARGTFRRERPRVSPDDPFSRGLEGDSFFSGHASGSWAVAAVFAGRYPGLSRGLFGLAAAISLSRIYEDAHWASDVLMGSITGYGIARLTLRLNDAKSDRPALMPVVGSEIMGGQLHFVF